jgi:hypothetical protein
MMNSAYSGSLAGVFTGLPAALSGAPWWAVGVIMTAAYLAIPLTGLVLDHIRQRKGDLVDEEFAATLKEISDPEKKIQAIIRYREAVALQAPQPPPEPPPGSQPSEPPSSPSSSVAT